MTWREGSMHDPNSGLLCLRLRRPGRLPAFELDNKGVLINTDLEYPPQSDRWWRLELVQGYNDFDVTEYWFREIPTDGTSPDYSVRVPYPPWRSSL